MKKIIGFIFLVGMLLSCSKNDISNINLDGNYTGIFTVTYTNGASFSNAVTVNFTEKVKYSSTGNGNGEDFYPAGGSGTYEISASKILFSDVNIWLAHFDWNLILNGEYDYVINGDKLTFSAHKNNVGFYKYELTKE